MTSADVAAALRLALEAVKDERATHAAMLARLVALAKQAVERFEAGDREGCHEACCAALDLAYDALGDCEAFESLCALLGYMGPAPKDGEVPS